LLIAASGHDGLIAVLVAAGSDVDHQNQYGNTALIMAARAGYKHCAAKLLAHGAKPTIRNKKRETARAAAELAGHALLAEQLASAEKEDSWLPF
jgi:ankyrin repeat protein